MPPHVIISHISPLQSQQEAAMANTAGVAQFVQNTTCLGKRRRSISPEAVTTIANAKRFKSVHDRQQLPALYPISVSKKPSYRNQSSPPIITIEIQKAYDFAKTLFSSVCGCPTDLPKHHRRKYENALQICDGLNAFLKSVSIQPFYARSNYRYTAYMIDEQPVGLAFYHYSKDNQTNIYLDRLVTHPGVENAGDILIGNIMKECGANGQITLQPFEGTRDRYAALGFRQSAETKHYLVLKPKEASAQWRETDDGSWQRLGKPDRFLASTQQSPGANA